MDDLSFSDIDFVRNSLVHAIRRDDVRYLQCVLPTQRACTMIDKINTGSMARHNPLFQAVKLGRVRCLEALLDAGLDQHMCDDKGLTPIHHAARVEYPDILLTLLQRGARVNARTRDGLTPLMLTLGYDDYPTNAAILLSYGADPDLTDRKGRNVYWKAQHSNGLNVHVVLREHRERRMAVVDTSGTVLPVELAELCGDYVLMTAVRRAIYERAEKADNGTIIDLID